MNYSISPTHVTESLVRAHQHWQERNSSSSDSESIRKPFTIAVSREAGTYGAAIAREVANRLGWPVYDCELIQRIADDLGVRRTLLDSVDERQVGWLNECVANFLSVPDVSENAYFRKLVETLLSLATHGECVIVGRGATVALPLATTLRVRVVAPIEYRIDAVQREHSISVKAATNQVATKDRERNQFVTRHFQIDPTNPANYDLVLNVARFSTTECADFVIAALDRIRAHSKSSCTPHALQATAGV
jgi:cytidylate kinase